MWPVDTRGGQKTTFPTQTPTEEFSNMSISKTLVNVKPKVLPSVVCKDSVEEAFAQTAGK